MTIEIRKFRKLLEAGLRYLNDACSIHELGGRADNCVLAARFWSGHPALRNMAADWATMIDRRWNAWGLLLDPLSENEFRTWLQSRLVMLSRRQQPQVDAIPSNLLE